MMRRLQAADDGISLVEVLVGIMIIGVTLTAFAGTLVQSLTNISGDEQFVRANQLAADELEGLRGLEWSALGFYTDDAGFAATVHDPLRVPPRTMETVQLGTTRPADQSGPSFPRPQRTIQRDGIDYQVSTEIVWVDSSRTAKELWIDLRWVVRGEPYQTSARSTRTPTLREMPATPLPPCTPGRLVSFDIAPTRVVMTDTSPHRNLDQVLVTATTCTPATAVNVNVALSTGNVALSLQDQGDQRRWRYLIPASFLTTAVGTYPWTATATSTSHAPHSLTRDVLMAPLGQFPLEVMNVAVRRRPIPPQTSIPPPLCVQQGATNLFFDTTVDIEVTGGATGVELTWTGMNGGTIVVPVTGDLGLVAFTIPSNNQRVARDAGSDNTTITVTAVAADGRRSPSKSVSEFVRTSPNSQGCS